MDIGHILSNSPPIAENIFKHLNARDLSNCAKVCSLWNRVAQTEKKRRRDIYWFFQGLHCVLHNKVHSSCRECSMDQARDIESDLHVQLKALHVHPGFCIAFASSCLLDCFQRLFPSFNYPSEPQKKKMKHDDMLKKRAYFKAVIGTAIKKYLPSQCEVAFCVAPGIIGCREDALPLEIEEGSAFTGLLLPQLPGLEVYQFSVDGQRCKVSDLIPDTTSIKCLLVFLTQRGISFTNKIVQSCLLKEDCKIAVGGAIVDRTESLLGSVIAICGPNVEAASVIIKPRDKKEQLESKLKLFQDTGLLKNRCFAFMFACVARGFYIYREYNLESSIFHKMYPHVPLIGLFGNGEIGVNYFPHLPTEKKVLRLGKYSHCTTKYLHSYTTVFVLVSLKL